MAGWLICSDDYREGRLIMTGRFRKLAIDNALMIMYALATAGEMTVLFHAAVVSIDGDDITLMGDGNVAATEHCTAADIRATATHTVDASGKMRYLYTRRRRWMARMWRRLLPVRKYLLTAVNLIHNA